MKITKKLSEIFGAQIDNDTEVEIELTHKEIVDICERRVQDWLMDEIGEIASIICCDDYYMDTDTVYGEMFGDNVFDKMIDDYIESKHDDIVDEIRDELRDELCTFDELNLYGQIEAITSYEHCYDYGDIQSLIDHLSEDDHLYDCDGKMCANLYNV